MINSYDCAGVNCTLVLTDEGRVLSWGAWGDWEEAQHAWRNPRWSEVTLDESRGQGRGGAAGAGASSGRAEAVAICAGNAGMGHAALWCAPP